MARQKRVLVVDDEAAIRMGMARMLGTRGYASQTIGTFTDAIRTLEREPFDVLLCDFDLKDQGDGVDVATHARAHSPHMLRIMITGNPDLPRIRRALQEHTIKHVFAKPLDIQALARAMGPATMPSAPLQPTIASPPVQEASPAAGEAASEDPGEGS